MADLMNWAWTVAAFLGIGLVIGLGAGAARAIWGVRTHSQRERLNRERFWAAIPALADMLSKEPGSRRNTADWERILSGFYAAGYTLDETTRLIQTVGGLFWPSDRFDFEDFLARKNAWSIRTFGPGDGRDRVEGLADHITKELDELRASPNDVEEWIDVAFLALDGAYRAGADPRTVAVTLEAKLAKNQGRRWPDWRTVPAGKAIEHERGTLADVFERELKRGQIDGIVRPTRIPEP